MSVLYYLGLIVAVFIGAACLYLLIVAVVPGFSIPVQPLEKSNQASVEIEAERYGPRKEVGFEVEGTNLSARLYLPQNPSGPAPCIIMGHGAGGTMDMGLEAYALRFQEVGFAVLMFDYRHFGSSGGQPRQLLWIPNQLEDWRAAIECARGLEEVDPARVALWGTSLSGGHVITLAAQDQRILCVSAQCPGLDGKAAGEEFMKREGLKYVLRLVMHGQRDLVRSWLGLSPHKIPLVGRPGTVAMMPAPDAWVAFGRLAPEGFVNEVCARIIIRGDKYRPVKQAQDVRCPVLLQICDQDHLTPVSAAEETAQRLGNLATVIHYPIGHFDIYLGDNFEKSVADQLAFFKKHL